MKAIYQSLSMSFVLMSCCSLVPVLAQPLDTLAVKDSIVSTADVVFSKDVSFTISNVKFDFAFIPGGTFRMGANDGVDNEKPPHDVTVSDYYMAKTEVTLEQFKIFVDQTGYLTEAEKTDGSFSLNRKTGELAKSKLVNWRHDIEGKTIPVELYTRPVIHVSWNDATAYCKWLSEKTQKNIHLPTEAEWEFAAGHGTDHTLYSWGNDAPSAGVGNVCDEKAAAEFGLDKKSKAFFAGYNDGYASIAPVASFKANPYGLYDMTGNVWEWCSDWYGVYGKKALTNPTGRENGTVKAIRGSGWFDVPRYSRITFRGYDETSYRNIFVGFRPAMN